MKDAIVRAQSLYKRQKFRLALELLESNLDLDSLSCLPVTEQLGTLDLLASLYEKQGLLGKARRNAVQMVRLDDRDPRGYLRLGKILQLIPGRVGEAIRVYERALRKVKPLIPNYQMFLEKQMNACRAKQKLADSGSQNFSSSQRKCDFVEILPRELLLLIFSQLSLRQRVNCTLVSKTWLHFFNSEPTFWVNLEFFSDSNKASGSQPTSKYRIVNSDTVLKYINRSSQLSALHMDFQDVFLKGPESLFKQLLSIPSQAARLQTLKFSTHALVNVVPVIQMIRHALAAQPNQVGPSIRSSSLPSSSPPVQTQPQMQPQMQPMRTQSSLIVPPPSSFSTFSLPTTTTTSTTTSALSSSPFTSFLATPSSKLALSSLRELKIYADAPEYDLRWCMANLPALEVLHIATTPRIKPQRLLEEPASAKTEIVCTNLEVVFVLGQCGTRVLSDILVSELMALPRLRSVDLHRVIPHFWPAMHGAVANPNLTRCGFTSEGSRNAEYIFCLPRFAGELTSLTLNDMALSCIVTMPLLPDGSRYTGGSRTSMQQLEYVELKRVLLAELNLAGLINSWGCARTLKTLVVHDLRSRSPTPYPAEHHMNFEQMPALEVLQFTGMDTLCDDCFNWILAACPNLRKLNLEGTIITGPKLVRLLQSNQALRVIRCPNIVDLSADTIAWVKSLKHLVVYF